MEDQSKTKQTLIQELAVLRERIRKLEQAESERRHADEEIRLSETKFRALAESTSTAIFLIQDTKYIYINPAFERMVGYTMDDLAGMNFWDFIHPDCLELVKTRGISRMQGEEVPPWYEIKFISKGGGIKWADFSAAVIQLDNKPTIVGSTIDITDRKEAEEALLISNERFRTFVENANDIVYSLSPEGIFTYVSPSWTEALGHDVSEVEGRPFEIFVNPEDLPQCYEILERTVRTGEKQAGAEYRVRHKDGTWRWHTTNTSVIRNAEGNPVIYMGIARDITDRKQAEEISREKERRLADIIEFLPDATLVIDRDGRVIAWNRAIEIMTGIRKADMIGKGNYEYSLPFYGERRPVLIDLALNQDREMEKRYTAIHRVGDILFGESFTPCLPGGVVHLSATASVLRDSAGEIVAAIECIRDNTERKRLEERLSRAEKMEGLGRLAGGVAHDLNNVLGVLVGYSELLAEKLPAGSPLTKYAANIMQSGLKGTAIIQDLLTLARRGVTVSEVVDLNRVVSDYLMAPEFEKLKSYHPNVKFWTELEKDILHIKGSPVHLSKTVMNLISNVSEAISDRGEVTIRTENRYLDRPIRGYDEIQEGDYVVLTVSDSGKGISILDIGKIFEPFYTKKVMGRSGTGLGLAVVWGTVKDHNGYIDVSSEEGKGTIFTLYFPATRDELTQAAEKVSLSAYTGRGESILVVDDIKEQRELAMSMLERLGYQVEAVAGGEEAIEHLRHKKADLVVLDMMMEPGIDGFETYRRIIEINPKQKAVIVSGFSETDRVRKAQEMGAGSFVRKPYILEKIGLAIRKELDRL